MRSLLFSITVVLLGCNAGLAQVSTMGSTAMGLSTTPGAMLSSPLNGPSPFSAATQTDAAADFQPGDAGNRRDLFPTIRTDCAGNFGGDHYFPIGNRNYALGSRRTVSALFHADTWKCGRSVDMVPTARNIVHECFSRHDRPGAAAARSTSSAVAFDCRKSRAGASNGTEPNFHVPAGRCGHDIVFDRVGGSAGDHFHARQHDRDHIADAPARQSLEHGMQLHAGRSVDQRRGIAAHDAANPGKPVTRRDSTGYHRIWRYQHRSDHDRGAYAEHIGMCRGCDHESGDTRHDGAGQCHGRPCDSRRFAAAVGLLRGKLAWRRPDSHSGHRSGRRGQPQAAQAPRSRAANPKMLFNGSHRSGSLCVLLDGPTALPPETVSD
jgi:hypothetical protein